MGWYGQVGRNVYKAQKGVCIVGVKNALQTKLGTATKSNRAGVNTAALLPRLFGTNPRSHHKSATGRV